MTSNELKDDRPCGSLCYEAPPQDLKDPVASFTTREPADAPRQDFETSPYPTPLPSKSAIPTTPTSPSPRDPASTTTTTTTSIAAPNGTAGVEAGDERGRRRKPLHPQKSLSLMDPNFRGVTLCFQVVVQGASSQLVITPIYSKNLARFQRRRRRLGFHSESDPDTSGAHSPPPDGPALLEQQQEQHHHQHQQQRPFLLSQRGRSPVVSHGGVVVKSCASCGTRRTPLWRDAEDGTPLCNACGIRYRKYRLRCGSCWHIPRKDNKVFPACAQCGGLLRFSQNRKC